MKKCIVFIMILWMVLMVVPAAGQESQSSLEAVTFFSEILGDDIAYNVYLPAGYADSQLEYPVIYLLHGRGDSMSRFVASMARN